MDKSLEIRAILTNDVEQYELCLPVTTIGTEGCHINIRGDSVESLHATIMYNKACRTFHMIDMFTAAGTRVNQRCLSNCFSKLNSGDVIKFGWRELPLIFLVTPTTKLTIATDPSSVSFEDILRMNSGAPLTDGIEEYEENEGMRTKMVLEDLEKRSETIVEKSREEAKVLTQEFPKNSTSLKKSDLIENNKSSKSKQSRPSGKETPKTDKKTTLTECFKPVDSEKNVKKIKEVLKSLEEKTTNKELLMQLEELKVESYELMQMINNLNGALFCKDDSIKLLKDCMGNLKKENEEIELKNEALMNSMNRRYYDCEGCRQEDLILKKDMELMKVKMQLLKKTESVEELKTCIECLNTAMEKLQKENKQLHVCLKELSQVSDKMKEKAEYLERTGLLSRVSGEKMMKQLELLKGPLLDMVNVVCDDEEDKNKIKDFKSLCQPGYLTNRPSSKIDKNTQNIPANNTKPAKGKKGKAQAEEEALNKDDNHMASVNKAKAFMEEENCQMQTLMNNENFIKTACNCVARLKKMKENEGLKKGGDTDRL